jgi:hypothetical protein
VAGANERSEMSDQDQEREQVDAVDEQEDMELPDEQSEDVKGGVVMKRGVDSD